MDKKKVGITGLAILVSGITGLASTHSDISSIPAIWKVAETNPNVEWNLQDNGLVVKEDPLGNTKPGDRASSLDDSLYFLGCNYAFCSSNPKDVSLNGERGRIDDRFDFPVEVVEFVHRSGFKYTAVIEQNTDHVLALYEEHNDHFKAWSQETDPEAWESHYKAIATEAFANRENLRRIAKTAGWQQGQRAAVFSFKDVCSGSEQAYIGIWDKREGSDRFAVYTSCNTGMEALIKRGCDDDFSAMYAPGGVLESIEGRVFASAVSKPASEMRQSELKQNQKLFDEEFPEIVQSAIRLDPADYGKSCCSEY